MIILAVLLALLIALGAASVLGWTADSRDADYGVGPMIDPRRAAGHQPLDRDAVRR